MEFYDNGGIVIDAGSQYMKIGFAGETFPRYVFPSTVGRFRRAALVDSGYPVIFCGHEALKSRGLTELIWPVKDGLVQDWDDMEKLWHHAYFKQLCVPPETTKLLHAVHPLTPKKHKEKMAEILFETFSIRGLFLAGSPVLSLYASGRSTGLVWENGSSCSHIEAIFEGFPLRYTITTSPITGEALSDYLQQLLKKVGYSFTTPFERELVDRIKSESCYVTNVYDSESAVQNASSYDKKKYELPDGQHVILRDEQFKCPELLFHPSLNDFTCDNITDSICKTIERCDVEYKSLMYQNIVMAGGSTLFPGLKTRLLAELTTKVAINPEYKPVIDEIFTRNFLAWNGGSMLASSSNHKGFWMTQEEYLDLGSDRVNYKFF